MPSIYCLCIKHKIWLDIFACCTLYKCSCFIFRWHQSGSFDTWTYTAAVTCRKSAKPDTSSASDKRLPVQCSVRARLTWNRRTAAEPGLECAVERGRYHVGYVCDNTTVCLWCTTVCAEPSWACLCSHTVVSALFCHCGGSYDHKVGHFRLGTVVPDRVHNNQYCIHSIRYHCTVYDITV